MRSLWRGSLLPFGAAGAVNRGCGVSEGIWCQDLGLLRSPREQAPSPQSEASYALLDSC
jgi:hypothetical protein